MVPLLHCSRVFPWCFGGFLWCSIVPPDFCTLFFLDDPLLLSVPYSVVPCSSIPGFMVYHLKIIIHCEIIDCYISIFFIEIQLKKENLRSVFWVLEFGCPNQYTGLPNDLDTLLISFDHLF